MTMDDADPSQPAEEKEKYENEAVEANGNEEREIKVQCVQWKHYFCIAE